METPNKISIDTSNIPSIIGGPMDYPALQISLTVPPVPDFPPFTAEIKIPPIEFNLPPIIFAPFPPITFPPINIPPITLEPTIAEKCKLVLQKIVELANEGKPIGFEQDFGDILVNNLYDLLIKGQGLSWA